MKYKKWLLAQFVLNLLVDMIVVAGLLIVAWQQYIFNKPVGLIVLLGCMSAMWVYLTAETHIERWKRWREK